MIQGYWPAPLQKRVNKHMAFQKTEYDPSKYEHIGTVAEVPCGDKVTVEVKLFRWDGGEVKVAVDRFGIKRSGDKWREKGAGNLLPGHALAVAQAMAKASAICIQAEQAGVDPADILAAMDEEAEAPKVKAKKKAAPVVEDDEVEADDDEDTEDDEADEDDEDEDEPEDDDEEDEAPPVAVRKVHPAVNAKARIAADNIAASIRKGVAATKKPVTMVVKGKRNK